MHETKELQEKMQRVEKLIDQIESLADTAARTSALEVVQTLMDFHSTAIERMMDLTAKAGTSGYAIFEDFAKDDLISALLVLYGLHPSRIEERVLGAIEKVRPSLSMHQGDVEFLGVTDGVVRLRLKGSCDGCPSSALTLKQTIEQAIYAAAPDVVSIDVEGIAVTDPTGFVQIGSPSRKVYGDCELAQAAG